MFLNTYEYLIKTYILLGSKSKEKVKKIYTTRFNSPGKNYTASRPVIIFSIRTYVPKQLTLIKKKEKSPHPHSPYKNSLRVAILPRHLIINLRSRIHTHAHIYTNPKPPFIIHHRKKKGKPRSLLTYPGAISNFSASLDFSPHSSFRARDFR